MAIRFSLLMLILALTGTLRAQPSTAESTADPKRAALLIVEQTNAQRKSNSLDPLKPNDALNRAAQEFAEFMAKTGEYGHEADGRQPAQRAEAAGYKWGVILENIGMQYRSTGFPTKLLAQRFAEAWKESPPHWKNIINPDVTEIGVGVAQAENGRYYAVQMFGRPEAAQIKFTLANQMRAAVKYRLIDQSLDLPPGVIRTHTLSHTENVKVTIEGATPETIDITPGATYVVTAGPNGKPAVRRKAD